MMTPKARLKRMGAIPEAIPVTSASALFADLIRLVRRVENADDDKHGRVFSEDLDCWVNADVVDVAQLLGALPEEDQLRGIAEGCTKILKCMEGVTKLQSRKDVLEKVVLPRLGKETYRDDASAVMIADLLRTYITPARSRRAM
jgi:hypothetical protein